MLSGKPQTPEDPTTTRDTGDAMADPPSYPDTGEDAGVERDRGSASSTPRWVHVLGIVIAIVLVLILVVLHLTGVLGPGAH
jgi:hypothetical protein